MTKFKYNVTKAKNNFEKIRQKLNLHKELYEKIFLNLKSLNNCWTDVAADAFLKKVADDEMDLTRLYQSLNLYQNNIENFTEELGDIFSKEGYSINNMDITFDTVTTNSSLGSLARIQRCADNALNDMRNCLVPSSYGYKYKIDEVYGALYDIQNDARNLYGSIEGLEGRVKGLADNIINKSYAIDYIELQQKPLTISYSIQSIIPRLAADFQKSKDNGISDGLQKESSFDVSNSVMQQSAQVNMNTDSIEIDESIDVTSKLQYLDPLSIVSNVQQATSNNGNMFNASQVSIVGNTVSGDDNTTKAISIEEADLRDISYSVIEAESSVSEDKKLETLENNINLKNIETNSTKFDSDDVKLINSDLDGIKIRDDISKNAKLYDSKLESAEYDDVSSSKVSASFENNGELIKNDEVNTDISSVEIDSNSSVNLETSNATIDLGSVVKTSSNSSATLEQANTSFDVAQAVRNADNGSINLQQASHIDASDIMNTRI